MKYFIWIHLPWEGFFYEVYDSYEEALKQYQDHLNDKYNDEVIFIKGEILKPND